MSNSFPYNQTVAAFSPVIGRNSGNTVIVAAYSSGYSISQIQAVGVSATNQLEYTWNCIGDLYNEGSSTTALLLHNTRMLPQHFLKLHSVTAIS